MTPVNLQAFEALGALVIVLEPNGKIVHWNRACSLLTGSSMDEVRGKHVWELLRETEEITSLRNALARASSDGLPRTVENHLTAATGERRLMAWSSSTVAGAHGDTLWIVMTGIDLTPLGHDHDLHRARALDLFEQAPDGIFVSDENGRYLDANEAGCLLSGYSRDEIIGKTVADLMRSEDVVRFREARARLTKGEAHVAESKIRCKDGTHVAVEVSARMLMDGRWQEFIRDISARKAREQESARLLTDMHSDRRWLQAVLDTAPLGILLFEPSGRLTFNRRAEELLGMSLSSTEGSAQYANRIFFPDGRPVPPDQLVSARVRRNEETIVGEEYIVTRPDGSRIPVLGSAAPIRDAEGRAIGAVGVFQDMSGRMRSEELIRNNERLLNGIFEILPVGVWIADETGRIVRTNSAGLRIWAGARYVGVSEFDQYKAWWADTGKPIAAEEWALARALTRGETSIGELIRIQCFDGTFKTIINSALPLHDEQGKFTGAIVVNEDVTSLKETEETLRRAVRAREEVLGVVAHDLRNPLNTILLQLERLCLPGKHSERPSQQVLERMQKTAMRMNRLIQDLLDVVRIDAGALTLERAPVPAARSLLTELVEAQRELASEASLELHLDVKGELPDLWADHDRLLQVLENLVGNAIKCTKPGGDITVGAAMKGSEVVFWVADTGIGIPAENLPTLFDRFWQGRRADRRGAGLGLAIAKGIIEAHGGRIWVESQLGVGTTFFFTVPVGDGGLA
jgi:PAS domain S-box-containing protein